MEKSTFNVFHPVIPSQCLIFRAALSDTPYGKLSRVRYPALPAIFSFLRRREGIAFGEIDLDLNI